MLVIYKPSLVYVSSVQSIDQAQLIGSGICASRGAAFDKRVDREPAKS